MLLRSNQLAISIEINILETPEKLSVGQIRLQKKPS